LIRLAIASCAIITSLCGCGFATFEQLDISSNLGERDDVLDDAFLRVDFSISPDHESVEKLFSLRAAGEATDAEFLWADRVLSIRPRDGWIKGRQYSCSLSGKILMGDGRTYTSDFIRFFYYMDPSGSIGVSSFSPGNDSFVGANDPLVIRFSKPVDISSFTEKFSLSPDREKKTVFSTDGTVATVIPLSGWQINTVYTWSLTDLRSADGYGLSQSYSNRFRSSETIAYPEVLSVCPVSVTNGVYLYLPGSIDGVVRNMDAIGVVFSNAIDASSAISALTIEPSIKGYSIADPSNADRIVFIPQEPYNTESRYRLEIAATAKSSDGLALREPYTCFFTSGNQWLSVTDILLDGTDNIVSSVGADPIAEHTMIAPVTPGDDYEITVAVSFSSAINEEKKNAVVKAIQVSAYFPATADIPYLTMVSWNPGNTVVTMRWKNFSASSSTISNYYTVKITGGTSGVTNGRGEFLKEDACVFFKAR
jgi:hypothetical protein